MKEYSLWLGSVEDLHAWSSPAMASTPPQREVPEALPCRMASLERSTPGALPYHIAYTPSCRAWAGSSICVPQTAVAARSSLRPGWKRTRWRSRCSRAPSSCRSKPPSVARDESRGVEPDLTIAQLLQHRQPDERLDPGQVDLSTPPGVLAIEGDRGQFHDGPRVASLSAGVVSHLSRKIPVARGCRNWKNSIPRDRSGARSAMPASPPARGSGPPIGCPPVEGSGSGAERPVSSPRTFGRDGAAREAPRRGAW